MEHKVSTDISGIKEENNRKKKIKEKIYRVFVFISLIGLWQYFALKIGIPLLLPTPKSTVIALINAITEKEVLLNLFVTFQRVIKGFLLALAIGVPIGFIMGLFPLAEDLLGGIVDSLRQVPIMAWVPLTIIWFGIGDGPTIFMIAMSGVFPVILNTTHGAKNISRDYYNAAKSMGAKPLSIFINVIIPASLPDILTGARIAVSSGWMSVIWAEFIATSAGLGYSMVEAQTKMQTEVLMALMFLSAFVGFGIDRILKWINNSLTKWRST